MLTGMTTTIVNGARGIGINAGHRNNNNTTIQIGVIKMTLKRLLQPGSSASSPNQFPPQVMVSYMWLVC